MSSRLRVGFRLACIGEPEGLSSLALRTVEVLCRATNLSLKGFQPFSL
ncbi:hypothetical protein [Scytonema sp. NUACC26]